MKPVSLGQFFQQLGQIMQETEGIGSQMNPYYEEIEKELKKNEEPNFTKETLAKVAMEFEDGVEKYIELEQKVTKMQAPAKLMMLFKQFQKDYQEYVRGCKMMLDAVDPEKGFNHKLFMEAEELQDKRSQALSKVMTRMMRFLR